MQPFEYANPSSLNDAFKLLGSEWGQADVLAGGTDQISLMKEMLHTPKRVVNIKNIKELSVIHRSGQGLHIGATVTFDQLASDRQVNVDFPSITHAALGITSPQIRNMGTVGGDLCQRPRCWYFRGGYGLLGLKDGKSLIPNGDNRYHAIFGGGPAYFVSASSLGPALIALGAKVTLKSAAGSRTIPVEQFFIAPQNEKAREIALKPNEILTEVLIPTAKVRNATYEIRQREAVDWPLATASVALTMDGSSISRARVVLGHVAPTPWVASKAEALLTGKQASDDLIQQAAEAAVDGAKPLSENSYKVQLTRVAVKRALMEASQRA
jgi:xanthine dehydrogenase YagS FAD-binding subunit